MNEYDLRIAIKNSETFKSYPKFKQGITLSVKNVNNLHDLIASFAAAYVFYFILKVIKRDLNNSYKIGYKKGHAKGYTKGVADMNDLFKTFSEN